MTTITSRSTRPVFRSRSFEVASTISFALPACKLRRRLHARGKAHRGVSRFLRLIRREGLVARPVLLNKCPHAAHAARIMHLHHHRRRLANSRYRRWKSDNRGGGAHRKEHNRQHNQSNNCEEEFLHTLF